jgi:hypothetical protein
VSRNDEPLNSKDKASEIEITLPEGQKLTIRSLEPGSVVEVASWRGAGKPDDSAIRMLFGAAANEPETNPIDEEPPSTKLERVRRRRNTPITESVSDETAEQIITRQQKKLERIMIEKRNSRKVLRRAVVTIASVLAFAGVITALNVSGIAEFHRPDSGITTGLGPASSSIAVVNNSVDIVSSSTVLITRGDESVLAGVAEVGDGSLVVFDETGQFTVARDDVQGRVLFVLPFLGYLGG